jgi:hypothetical protein
MFFYDEHKKADDKNHDSTNKFLVDKISKLGEKRVCSKPFHAAEKTNSREMKSDSTFVFYCSSLIWKEKEKNVLL